METDTAVTTPNDVTPPKDLDYTWPFGKQHKRSRRIIGIVVLVCLLAPVIWILFEGELQSAFWHLRHGNEFVYEGVAYHVEYPQYARCWRPATCTVSPGYGLLRWKLAHPRQNWIAFGVKPGQSSQDANRRRATVLKWALTGERSLNVAGTEMRCEEYLQSDNRNHSIYCYSPASPVVITSIGNGDSTEFYALLSSAKRK